MGDLTGFTVVLRGYDPAEVDALLERIRAALAATDWVTRRNMREELAHVALRVKFRGYDRIQVDEYLRRAIDRLA
jgi:DivIVA domain-containing protein